MFWLEGLYFENTFWKGDLDFLCILKMIAVISNVTVFTVSHAYKYTNSAFSLWILFSTASALFQNFFRNETHIKRTSFWFWERKGSTIGSIYGLILLSRAPQDGIDTTVSKSFISFSVHIRTAKISYHQERYNLLRLLNKTFTLFAPHNNYPHPTYNWKF